MDKKTALALLSTSMAAAGLYRYRRQLSAQALRLPPPRFAVGVERNIRLPVSGGVRLATDHYFPKHPGTLPTILIRTPYGRGGLPGLLNVLTAEQFAACGYHVICQDVRGCFGSEGDFEPFVHEAADGRATVDWIVSQSWSNGAVGTWGQSYVGFTGWAAAATGTPAIQAMLPSVTSANFSPIGLEGFPLDMTLRWLVIMDSLNNGDLPPWERLSRVLSAGKQERLLAPGLAHLPLATVDEAVLGKPVPFFQKWRQYTNPQDAYWRAMDVSDQVDQVQAAVHLVSGWHDIFLGGLLADYQLLQANGRQPYLTIGPWNHFSLACELETLRQGLIWFDAHLSSRVQRLRKNPIRIYLMGADEWLDIASWPPPYEARPYFLHAQGLLSPENPGEGPAADSYRYDPADPTPNVGGPLLSAAAGPQDNRPLEARPDVLTYTSQPLNRALDVVGPVCLRLYVSSDRQHTSFFGRLCDVQPDGRSLNICDGLFRLTPERGEPQPDGSIAIEIDMTATAQRFEKGHRIRLQVSSGAHPRFARNLGTGEPVLTGIQMAAARQTVYRDSSRPSALFLPIAG